MSHNTQLSTVNSALQSILNRIEAYEPSGNTSIQYDVCNVDIQHSNIGVECHYIKIVDGVATFVNETYRTTTYGKNTLSDVLCGSIVLVKCFPIENNVVSGISYSGVTYESTPLCYHPIKSDTDPYIAIIAFAVPTSSNVTSLCSISSIKGIQFYIGENGPYIAQEGQSWYGWIDSGYNTDGYKLCESCGMVWHDNTYAVFDSVNNTGAIANLSIIDGHTYTLYNGYDDECQDCEYYRNEREEW